MSGSLKRGLSISENDEIQGVFRQIESPKLNRRNSDDLTASTEVDIGNFDKG
jgi:hypothetical protein